jgi:hypothetical protein
VGSTYVFLNIYDDPLDPPVIVVNDAPTISFAKIELGDAYMDAIKDALSFDAPNIAVFNDLPLFDRYYGLVRYMLNENKLATVPLMLNEVDLHNLDFSLPVYLGYPYYAYFFISKIDSYTDSEAVTSVELVKIA